MIVNALETLRLTTYPNMVWLQLHTDQGLVGLGETFRGAEAVVAQLHESVAPYILGKDPLQIDRHSQHLRNSYNGFASTSVEMRAASATDIALWDLSGQAIGQPIYQLLGGQSRPVIQAYNTCASDGYNNRAIARRVVADGDSARTTPQGRYDDQRAFMTAADDLAHSLLEEGYTAMKIWPFDIHAERSGGMHITGADLRKALEPFEKIRRAVGDRIDIMSEFHSMWNLPTAIRIAHALEPLEPFWSEDPIKMDNVAALAEYARSTRIPVCASETLATRSQFRDLLQAEAVAIVMFDLGWCGGLSEARKIASLAETFQRPVAPHDCTGPVVLTASVHLALNAPNALYQEVVRAFMHGWYRDILTELPPLVNGTIGAPTGAGLGTRLLPGLAQRDDAIVRRSELNA